CRNNCGSGTGSVAEAALGGGSGHERPIIRRILLGRVTVSVGAAMGAIGSIDWSFLEFFFGDHGRITATVIVLLLTTISLLISTVKYLAARLATKERDDGRRERDEARLSLQKQLRKVQEKEEALAATAAELTRKTTALSLTAAIQHDQETALKEREQKLSE